MNIVSPEKIEDIIVSKLIYGEQASTSLLNKVRERRENTTKQGFYAVLRKLRKNEVILVYKGIVSLNTSWIKKIKDMFETADSKYLSGQRSFDALRLEDGESLSYMFNNLNNLDIFWGHSQNIFLHNSHSNEAVYCYDPHYWLYLARNESEIELLNQISKNKRQFFMNVGYSYFLDKIIKKNFRSDYLQYNHNRISDKNNYYVTVIGDYITEVYLDKKTSNIINEFYEKTSELNDSVISFLKKLLSKKIRSRIKITRNSIKSAALKKKLGKNFYILK